MHSLFPLKPIDCGETKVTDCIHDKLTFVCGASGRFGKWKPNVKKIIGVNFSKMSEYYKKLLYELHELICQGKDDGPEADVIRDLMDVPWRSMSETEKQKMRELAASLPLDSLYEKMNMNEVRTVHFEDAKIIKWLYELAQDSEWQTQHAAEDKYCPYCADKDLWRSQSKHNDNCQYVLMMKKAKVLVESLI